MENASIFDKLELLYNQDKYEDLVNTVSDVRYKTGVKHLLYYLVVKELKELSNLLGPFLLILFLLL